jgi:hypothetical protein
VAQISDDQTLTTMTHKRSEQNPAVNMLFLVAMLYVAAGAHYETDTATHRLYTQRRPT